MLYQPTRVLPIARLLSLKKILRLACLSLSAGALTSYLHIRPHSSHQHDSSSFTHRFIHSLIHSLNHSLTRAFIHSFIQADPKLLPRLRSFSAILVGAPSLLSSSCFVLTGTRVTRVRTTATTAHTPPPCSSLQPSLMSLA